MKPKRLIVFRLISLLVPFVLLFLLELTLRIFHYGYDLNLFIEYPRDKNFLFLNPDASKKYFSNQRNATTGNVEPFRKKKDANTLRIFVLGESTTIGYPYFHNGSFHRWLQYRLTHTYPDRNFEIINVSLTAVNSYTVSGFAREVVNYQPDAVMIYTGHNEYYGALGVGSTEKIGGSRFLVKLILYLREFKITQLLTALIEKVNPLNESANATQDGTRMQRMAADQKIVYQSELYQRGVTQFRHNLNETLEVFNKNDIPVFISNLVSNEKDLKPFVSFSADNSKFPEFSKSYDEGLKALKSGDNQTAFNSFQKADQIYDGHALCNYYLGQTSLVLGNVKLAAACFSKARDLDGLRFRAPSVFNTTIKDLADRYSNVYLVDTKAIFEANSTNHIVGDALILEHVHPDLKGYALMSDVFYKALQKARLVDAEPAENITFPRLLNEMPITRVDSLSGLYKVEKLKNSWPFKETMHAKMPETTSFEAKLAFDLANRKIQWLDAMNALFDYYIQRKDLINARKTVETLVLEYPLEAGYYLKSAMLNGEMRDENKALFSFKKAFALSPSFDIAWYIFVICLKTDRPAEAMPYLDYAVANNTSRFDLNQLKANAQTIVALQKRYRADTTNTRILNQIAQVYLKMDNKEAAFKYVQKVLKTEPQNKTALTLAFELK
ncbi:hypothetical protein [Dyadobacter sp. LHD-138]|uniref:hypothetical protein n=1 Tax=Dyadobacter sp. LHD-138 TaxID=3071413 RepID=UPI0027DED174|nr:hypothetical protein [Dyadobacter sp. LHD-138]MDQ6479262.1 hypothetical protein [Dyadobacter sp. LHD-138]